MQGRSSSFSLNIAEDLNNPCDEANHSVFNATLFTIERNGSDDFLQGQPEKMKKNTAPPSAENETRKIHHKNQLERNERERILIHGKQKKSNISKIHFLSDNYFIIIDLTKKKRTVKNG